MSKKSVRQITELCLLVSYAIVLATVFVVSKQLENGVVSGKYFWFYRSMGITVIVSFIYSLISKQPFRFSVTDGFVFLFVCSIFLSALCFADASANTTKLVLLFLLFVLYLCLRLILSSKRLIIQMLCFCIILTGLIEAVWGMRQLYGFLPSQHNLFKLTGSFFNPGPYSGYLAVVFPLALYYWICNDVRVRPCGERNIFLKGNTSYRFTVFAKTLMNFFDLPFLFKIISAATCIAITLVLPAGMSRASWLAAIAGSLVVIFGRYGEKLDFNGLLCRFAPRNDGEKDVPRNYTGFKILAVVLVTGILIVSFVGMYYLKKDSADGRLLTWKVSLSALVKHPLGVGLGHFPNAYGEAQASYFASGEARDMEEFVAGNPEYGFNEFLQIAVESGIASLLLFFGIMVCAIRKLIACKDWGVTGSLAALLVFACFSYPFSVLPFPVVLVFLLAFSGGAQMTQTGQKNTDSKSKPTVFVLICCMTATLFCLWKQYPVYHAYRQWRSHQMHYHAGRYKEVVQSYEPLYPCLNDQIKFLFEYGRSLAQSEQPGKSNEVLQQAVQISCDPMLYNITGKNYQAMHEYDLAEENFKKASLIVPNRIYPCYLLMKLYLETGDKEKAFEYAGIVLTKEPKVQSTAVREMREEAERIRKN